MVQGPDGQTWLKVKVMDYDLVGASDLMGVVSVDLGPLADKLPRRSQFYTLRGEKGEEGGRGEVEIGLWWKHNPDLVPAEDDDGAEGTADGGVPDELLSVVLVRGRNLLAMDKSSMLSKGATTSDPVVKFQLGGHQHRSSTKRKTLSPEWHEKFSLPVPVASRSSRSSRASAAGGAASGAATLEIDVYDVDSVGFDDIMGSVRIDLETLSDLQEHQGWYPLLNRKGNSKGNPKGNTKGRDKSSAKGELEADKPRGELELKLWRHYNPAAAPPRPTVRARRLVVGLLSANGLARPRNTAGTAGDRLR